MNFPDDENGDVLRNLFSDGFDFTREYVVDFHAVYATAEYADKVARLYVEDLRNGEALVNIETKPHEEGGMCLDLAVKMIVSYDSITEFEERLASRTPSTDGFLDGWGVLFDPAEETQ